MQIIPACILANIINLEQSNTVSTTMAKKLFDYILFFRLYIVKCLYSPDFLSHLSEQYLWDALCRSELALQGK